MNTDNGYGSFEALDLPGGQTADWVARNGSHDQRWLVAGGDDELSEGTLAALVAENDAEIAGSLLNRQALPSDLVNAIYDRHESLQGMAQLHTNAPSALKLSAPFGELMQPALAVFLDDMDASEAERRSLFAAHDRAAGPGTAPLQDFWRAVRP